MLVMNTQGSNMKNYWLNKKIKSGFPTDDEYSPCDCNVNLDLFYPDRFIQDEVMQVLDSSRLGTTVYQTIHTPVIASSVAGTIRFGGCDAFIFTLNDVGALVCTRTAEVDVPFYTYIYRESSYLNYTTGVLNLCYYGNEIPKVIMCYEYNKGA